MVSRNAGPKPTFVSPCWASDTAVACGRTRVTKSSVDVSLAASWPDEVAPARNADDELAALLQFLRDLTLVRSRRGATAASDAKGSPDSPSNPQTRSSLAQQRPVRGP